MKSVLNVKTATILIFIQCLPTLFYRDFPNNTTNMMVYMSYSGITMVNKTLAISYKNP